MEINFETAGSYAAGIAMLRGIAKNTNKNNIQHVTLVYYGIRIQVIINLASNSAGGLSGALYVIGFVAESGLTYTFTDAVGGVAGTGLGFEGSYGALGQGNSSLVIGLADIAAAFGALRGYKGNGDAGFKRLMSILVIAISEAIRFASVEAGIANVLGGGTYAANFALYKSWNNGELGTR